MRLDWYEAQPQVVQFETICGCNARCVFCCYPSLRRSRGKMDWALIERIITQAGGAQTLIPFLLGEPLLDDRMRDVLALCKATQPKAKTVLYSNMSRCDQAAIEWIVQDQNLDIICPSFYGPTPETYRELQPPLDFHQVRSNIIRLIAERRRLQVPKPRVQMNYILTDLTRPHLKRFVDYWRPLADTVEVVYHDTWHGEQPERDSMKVLPPGPIPCSRLWESLNIHQDGTAVACCIDHEQQEKIGRLPEQSLLEIWHGEPLARLRRLHLAGRHAEIPLCRDCTSWLSNPAWWTGFWIRAWYGFEWPRVRAVGRGGVDVAER